MASEERQEGESLGAWLMRVRGERYQEAAEAKAKAEQEAIAREAERASMVINGIVFAVERALAEEEETGGVEKRTVIASLGFVKREDFDWRATRLSTIEDVYQRGKDGKDHLPVALDLMTFRETSALRGIVAACWAHGLDCWLTHGVPDTGSVGAEAQYGLAVSPNLDRITRPKAKKKIKKG